MTRRTSRALIVVAALFAAGSGAAVIATVATASSPGASALVPITPCRLLDTRPGSINVGTRSTPLAAGETVTVDTWGTNGNCTIPTGATGLSLNVVAISPTASSFLTVFPGDVARPTASSLNWVAGQAPTPNGVTTRVGADGRLSLFNLAGTVDLAVDVVGYYETVGAGGTGPAGPPGPAGTPAADVSRIIWVAEDGGDFTTISAALASITDNDASHRYLIRVAPGTYVENAGIDLAKWVDIVGSGPTTVIQSNGTGTNGAVIRGDTDVIAQVRDLRIVTTGPRVVHAYKSDLLLSDLVLTSTTSASSSSAVYIDSADVRIERVTVDASSSGFDVDGIEVVATSDVVVEETSVTVHGIGSGTTCSGIGANNATMRLHDVDVTFDNCSMTYGISGIGSTVRVDDARIVMPYRAAASARGLHFTSSTATLDMIDVGGGATAGEGMRLFESEVLMYDSAIRGLSTSISLLGSGVDVHVYSSLLEQHTFGMFGLCSDVIDGTYVPYACD